MARDFQFISRGFVIVIRQLPTVQLMTIILPLCQPTEKEGARGKKISFQLLRLDNKYDKTKGIR